jgi:hypothetical protein
LVPENLDSVDKLVAYVEFKLAVIKSWYFSCRSDYPLCCFMNF